MARTSLLKWNNKAFSKDSNAKVLVSFLAGALILIVLFSLPSVLAFDAKITPYAVVSGSNVTIDFNILESNLLADSRWVSLTYPNGSSVTINNFPYVFSDTKIIGRYDLIFYVNDTEGNQISKADYFESFNQIDFDFSIVDNSKGGVKSNWEIFYRDQLIKSGDSSHGNHFGIVPDTLVDLKIKSHDDVLHITLHDFNVSLEDGKSFGIDKHEDIEHHLVTYGIDNSYEFSKAIVRIHYHDLDYSEEDNLHLYRCYDYDFFERSCLEEWVRITDYSTHTPHEDHFEHATEEFSGFAIKEYVPHFVEEEVEMIEEDKKIKEILLVFIIVLIFVILWLTLGKHKFSKRRNEK